MKLVIRLEHVYPPIPDRRFDWSAALDGYEPPDPLGYGPTKWEAVRDLIDQLEDREENGDPPPSPPYDTLEEKKQSYE
jgi:hypothetical protein